MVLADPEVQRLTNATCVVIFVPPAAPSTKSTEPLFERMILGVIELSGWSPGVSIFAGDGGKPYEDSVFGIAKSSISLFSIMPSDLERLCEPHL